MKKRVLIANRGEIALRAIEACSRLGLESVSVYSSADRTAPHAWAADRSVCIGPPPGSQSYLNVDALLHVAEATGCGLVYPGYGFLAENENFARRCADAGLTFIGPAADTIRDMGDKARARELARSFGVPVVPGSATAYGDAREAEGVAAEVGYPLLLKASAGGGGRGMRVCREPTDFIALFGQASREAKEAFGDPSVYLERYFDRVRHLEVQVFGDTHGNMRQLGERDCSTQRRHQKLVEEAPSPALTSDERVRLLEAAVKLAAGVGYVGAGTIEFIFDEASRAFYFIEMNTRIQVEHPVTEARIGHDLIEEQLRVALGEPLSIPQETDWPGGHAMEFRINAEDAARGFVPSPGTIGHWQPPVSEGLRIDTFVYPGIKVQPYYDSMVAKLIVHGTDRQDVLERSRQALDSFGIEGISTTREFHRALLDDPDFASGKIHTRWVETEFMQRSGLGG
jgi:acetyl-CoA carboxylase biotin carboxylase subunit